MVQAINIDIDLTNMLIGDLETIDKAGRNELPITELIDVLDRVVVGGARHLPVTVINDITTALMEEITAVANPESAEAGGN